MYYRSNTNENVTVITDRSSEGLADANIRIGDLNGQITDLEIKLEAMYRVMVEQGVDPKLFDAKIEEIMKERQEKKGLVSAKPQVKFRKKRNPIRQKNSPVSRIFSDSAQNTNRSLKGSCSAFTGH